MALYACTHTHMRARFLVLFHAHTNTHTHTGQELGAGWREWCEERFGQEEERDDPPWGAGRNGHERLLISGMPAPRFDQHVDSNSVGKVKQACVIRARVFITIEA